MVFLDFILLPNVLLFIEQDSMVRAERVRTRAVALTLITVGITPSLIFLLRRKNAEKQSEELIKDETDKVRKQRKLRLLILLTAAHILIGLLVSLYVLNVISPLYTFAG